MFLAASERDRFPLSLCWITRPLSRVAVAFFHKLLVVGAVGGDLRVPYPVDSPLQVDVHRRLGRFVAEAADTCLAAVDAGHGLGVAVDLRTGLAVAIELQGVTFDCNYTLTFGLSK